LIASIFADNSNYFVPQTQSIFELFLAKFATTIAMHLNIYHQYSNSMNIMKYVNNHPYKFDQDSIAFGLGVILLMFSMIFEVCNMVVLFSRSTVYFTIGAYITLEVLICLQTFYYKFVIAGDANHNRLKDVYNDENQPKITRWNRTIDFNKRSCKHKIFRVWYKIIRGLYVSVIYYFVPFLFLYCQKFITPPAAK